MHMASAKTIKGYVMVAASGLLLLAIAVLLLLQIANRADFSLYGANMTPSTAVLMILSAAGGIAVFYLVRTLFKGLVHVSAGRQLSDAARKQD